MDWDICELNEGCKWRTGPNYCFGRKNDTIKYYEMHTQILCEYDDFNITKPIDVKVTISNYTVNNNNYSYHNCSELSSKFSFNGPQHFIGYGTFDQCPFHSDYINKTSIQHVHIFCELNNVWEPCILQTNKTYAPPGVILNKYECQCGQLQFTEIPYVVYHGGLSHHGYYIENTTINRIDRPYPICVQMYHLFLYL